jgi:phage gp29-like protein
MNTIPREQAKPPYTIAIIDLLDAMHYADVFDDERYDVIPDITHGFTDTEKCIALADRLFFALNPRVKTQADWYEFDDGWDVRVYESERACVYAGHQKLPEA